MYIFEDLEEMVLGWADKKGIFENSSDVRQFDKLAEEVKELQDALLADNQEEVVDAIGDCLVVLTVIAKMRNTDLASCYESAYRVIAKRTGKMVDGVFVKDEA
jgi:NTP pyrophosphatase (non-canonical NTP hydrolase)